ncbi:MAG: hypothetical protein ACKOF9_08110 [Burkholderiales bacterium]
MATTLDSFPISGTQVADLLRAVRGSEDVWVIESIETLSQENGACLGDLWRRSQMGALKVKNHELCSALVFAVQVISLDLYLEADPAQRLYIDDGEKVECTFC